MASKRTPADLILAVGEHFHSHEHCADRGILAELRDALAEAQEQRISPKLKALIEQSCTCDPDEELVCAYHSEEVLAAPSASQAQPEVTWISVQCYGSRHLKCGGYTWGCTCPCHAKVAPSGAEPR
jgi:hypothetical protein